ncbi:MAG: DDE-type integrase/transposase/recombinase [Tildeniella torsiva UHER 1998/13D]|jgi:transposase InsO family protein|nr:DDE-type integrase/transposase/recombinase [Tildeniella torsiva UHER 1998/13D]
MTYIWTTEGWLYLAVIIDLFSRQVVGWSMAKHMRTELVLTALGAALGQRQPAPSGLLFILTEALNMPVVSTGMHFSRLR